MQCRALVCLSALNGTERRNKMRKQVNVRTRNSWNFKKGLLWFLHEIFVDNFDFGVISSDYFHTEL